MAGSLARRSGRKYNPRLGRLFFFVPLIIIGILVVYAFVELNLPGTLMITAQDENGNPLHVTASVSGNNYTTPQTLKLGQGSYTVDFATLAWYYPPQSRSVSVTPGHEVYAVGVYTPAVKYIQVTPSGFNVTSITVMHGLTPVTWINPSTSLVLFSGGPMQTTEVRPGATYTTVFPVAEVFTVNVVSSNQSLTITVL